MLPKSSNLPTPTPPNSNRLSIYFHSLIQFSLLQDANSGISIGYYDDEDEATVKFGLCIMHI